MDLNLKGRLALVTGSSRGLGKAIAMALAMEGADVIINGRNREKLNQTALEIGLKSNTNIHNCCVDTTKVDEINKFFEENSRWLTKLDILVNNTGNLEKFGLFFDLKDEDWLKQYELTCLSVVRFSRIAYPYLKDSGHGRIINIGSLPAHQPGVANHHYAAAKAALLPLTKMMANQFAKDNILVNIICPSTLLGGGWVENVKRKAERDNISAIRAEEIMLKEESSKSPLGRIGQLDDVANLVTFLASDLANFMTGQCLNVDGGITRSIL